MERKPSIKIPPHVQIAKTPSTKIGEKTKASLSYHRKISGAVCSKCNLQLQDTKGKRKSPIKEHTDAKQQKFSNSHCHDEDKNHQHKFFIPVIAHNMRGNDSHLIVKHYEKLLSIRQ